MGKGRDEQACFLVGRGNRRRLRSLLVSAGADINNTDDSGPNRTQLDIAELSDWPEVAAALRRLGAKRYSELNVSS